jgi:hypothetical protein
VAKRTTVPTDQTAENNNWRGRQLKVFEMNWQTGSIDIICEMNSNK